jgi:LytS/YehU family sensor histidine kinase
MVKQRFEENIEILIDIEQDSMNFTIPPFALQIAVSHSRFVKKDHVILNYFSSSLNINIFRSKTA